MDIRLYFGSTSTPSTSVSRQSSSSSDNSDVESLESTAPKKAKKLVTLFLYLKRNTLNQGNTVRSGKEIFVGWNMMRIVMEYFARFARSLESHF